MSFTHSATTRRALSISWTGRCQIHCLSRSCCELWMLLWNKNVWMFLVSVPTSPRISLQWRNCLKLREFSPCDVMSRTPRWVLLLVGSRGTQDPLSDSFDFRSDFQIGPKCDYHWIWNAWERWINLYYGYTSVLTFWSVAKSFSLHPW